jgi:hypothetical protein
MDINDFPRWYILGEDGKPERAEVMTAAGWFETQREKRIIEKTNVPADQSCDGEKCEVSTVFLCLDHGISNDASSDPVLWETMIFGGRHNDYQERYTSLEDAKLGHKKAVWIARGGLDQEHEQAG